MFYFKIDFCVKQSKNSQQSNKFTKLEAVPGHETKETLRQMSEQAAMSAGAVFILSNHHISLVRSIKSLKFQTIIRSLKQDVQPRPGEDTQALGMVMRRCFY